MEEKTGIKQEERDDKGRFLPGVSGNPNGKPKGARHMSTLLEEAIRKVAEDTGTSEDQAIVRALIEKAKAGDIRAITEVWDRLEGKPKQQTDITSGGDKIVFVTPEIANKYNINVADSGTE